MRTVRPAAFSTIRSPNAPSSSMTRKPSAWPDSSRPRLFWYGDQNDGSATVPIRKPARPTASDPSGRAMLLRRSARRSSGQREGARVGGREPLQLQRDGAQLAMQDGGERHLLAHRAVHQDSVAAVEIAQDDARVVLLQDRVAPRDRRVEQHEIARRVAADGRRQAGEHRLAHDRAVLQHPDGDHRGASAKRTSPRKRRKSAANDGAVSPLPCSDTNAASCGRVSVVAVRSKSK